MKMKKIVSYLLLVSLFSFNGLGALALEPVNNAKTEPVNAEKEVSLYSGVSKSGPVIEHMPKQKNKYLNTVRIQDNKAVITQGNILKIKFAQEFSSKTAKTGDKVIFILDEDLMTQESTKLFPSGTQIIATVQGVEPPAMWNKNAKVLLSLGEIKLPNGQSGTINARIYSKDSTLKRSGWATFGKISGLTVGGFGLGAGVGAGIGAIAHAVGIGCFAIGMPVGGGLGLIIGAVTPGVQYKVKPGKTIQVQLTQDLQIHLNKIS